MNQFVDNSNSVLQPLREADRSFSQISWQLNPHEEPPNSYPKPPFRIDFDKSRLPEMVEVVLKGFSIQRVSGMVKVDWDDP
jgi:hypothetical protein